MRNFLTKLVIATLIFASTSYAQESVFGRATVVGPVTFVSSNNSAWTTKAYTCAVDGGSTPTTTVTCTLSTPASIGDSIFCGGLVFTSSGETMSFTDSNSDSFTNVGSQFNSTNFANSYQLGWLPKATTSITTLTMNVSPAIAFPEIFCQVATDTGTPSTDGSVCTGTIAPGNGPASCSGSITLAATDYVFSFAHTNDSSTVFVAGSGFTLGSNLTGNNPSTSEYGIFSGSVTPSIAWTGAFAAMDITAAAFQP